VDPELIPRCAGSQPTGGFIKLSTWQYIVPAVTFPAEKRHRPSASTELYCLVTEAHWCEQLAQGCYSTAQRPGIELSHQSDVLATRLSSHPCVIGERLNQTRTYSGSVQLDYRLSFCLTFAAAAASACLALFGFSERITERQVCALYNNTNS